MSNDETKPFNKTIGTLELVSELKGLPAILAGLEQIKVAAQDAAAAVASIGADAGACEVVAGESVSDDALPLILVELRGLRDELKALRADITHTTASCVASVYGGSVIANPVLLPRKP